MGTGIEEVEEEIVSEVGEEEREYPRGVVGIGSGESPLLSLVAAAIDVSSGRPSGLTAGGVQMAIHIPAEEDRPPFC